MAAVVTAAAAPPGVDGRLAWRIAFTVAVANGFTFGVSYTFGAFFDAMAEDFDAGLGATAMIFAITVFLFFGLGIVSGPLGDRYGPRPLVACGAVLVSGGLLLTSQVQELWVGYLTYGIGVGVGAGLYVAPLVATVSGWFSRQRALAIGVSSAGNGLGTLLLVPLAARLIDAYGWRTSYVILGIAAAVVLGVTAVVVRRPPIAPPPPARERLRVVAGTRELRILASSALLMSVALFSAFAFIVPFAKDDGVSSRAAAVLVGIVGASSILGRIGISFFARRLGPVRSYQACLATLPVAYVVWFVAGGTYALLMLFAVLLGIGYGGFVALGPVVTAHLFGVVGIGSVIGLTYLGAGIGGLIGPPVAGFLAEATDGHLVPIAFTVLVTVAATALTMLLPTGPTVIEEVSAGTPA